LNKFHDILKGGDLRSIGRSNDIVAVINSQHEFDELFIGLRSSDRKVVMRTADAIEKITKHNTIYLQKHKKELLNLCQISKHIELKWHLALLITRLRLSKREFGQTWDTLTKWATDRNESKIVRVNSIQGLFNLLQVRPELTQDFNLTVSIIEKEKTPSINARIKKIKNTSH
jgi:hypothetical protein